MCHNMRPVGGGVVSVASGACGMWSMGIVADGLWMRLRIAVAFIHCSCEPWWRLRFVCCGVCGLCLRVFGVAGVAFPAFVSGSYIMTGYSL